MQLMQELDLRISKLSVSSSTIRKASLRKDDIEGRTKTPKRVRFSEELTTYRSIPSLLDNLPEPINLKAPRPLKPLAMRAFLDEDLHPFTAQAKSPDTPVPWLMESKMSWDSDDDLIPEWLRGRQPDPTVLHPQSSRLYELHTWTIPRPLSPMPLSATSRRQMWMPPTLHIPITSRHPRRTVRMLPRLLNARYRQVAQVKEASPPDILPGSSPSQGERSSGKQRKLDAQLRRLYAMKERRRIRRSQPWSPITVHGRGKYHRSTGGPHPRSSSHSMGTRPVGPPVASNTIHSTLKPAHRPNTSAVVASSLSCDAAEKLTAVRPNRSLSTYIDLIRQTRGQRS